MRREGSFVSLKWIRGPPLYEEKGAPGLRRYAYINAKRRELPCEEEGAPTLRQYACVDAKRRELPYEEKGPFSAKRMELPPAKRRELSHPGGKHVLMRRGGSFHTESNGSVLTKNGSECPR